MQYNQSFKKKSDVWPCVPVFLEGTVLTSHSLRIRWHCCPLGWTRILLVQNKVLPIVKWYCCAQLKAFLCSHNTSTLFLYSEKDSLFIGMYSISHDIIFVYLQILLSLVSWYLKKYLFFFSCCILECLSILLFFFKTFLLCIELLFSPNIFVF